MKRESKENQARLVHQVVVAREVRKERGENLDLRERKADLDLQVHLDHGEIADHKERKDQADRREP